MRIPLPSRSLVRPPVDERMSPRAANASLGAAGADETEPDAPQRVTAYPAVVDTQRNTAYRHGMESHGSAKDTFGRGGASIRDSGEGVPAGAPVTAPGKAAHHPLAAGQTSPLSANLMEPPEYLAHLLWYALKLRDAIWDYPHDGDDVHSLDLAHHHACSLADELSTQLDSVASLR